MDYKAIIKKLRNKMLLTQSEFAKELGVSIASVATMGHVLWFSRSRE